MPKLDIEKSCITRSKGGYIPFKPKDDKFNTSFFVNTLKIWNNLPANIQCKEVYEFKLSIKEYIKPPRYKHFSRGNKFTNKLLTRIRVGRSDLNQHKFTIGLVDSPECSCHFTFESPEHFFLSCFLYSLERQTLFSLVEHYIPKFPRLNRKQKLDILLKGINPDDEQFTQLNTTLTKAVQHFILSTKRFATTDNKD